MSESHDIEQIARALARRRMLDGEVGAMIARYDPAQVDEAFDRLWRGTSEQDERQRQSYRADARAILPLIRAAEVRGAENMRARAMAAIRTEMKGFSAEEYAVGQPMASFSERFACDVCLRAVAALPPIAEG